VGLHPFRHKINPGVGGKNLKISTKDLALTTIYAALYAALVFVTLPFSFNVAQVRIAGILRPAIAKKWILAFGYGIGALVANVFSPFAGPWDLVFMPVMSVLAGLAGYFAAKPFKGNYFISGAVTAAIISVSLSLMFDQLGIAPMFIALPYLFVVEQALCLVGAIIFRLIETRIKWWNL
jgi:uncharacterized membrane protein